MLEHDLAIGVLVAHPLETARVLERLPAEESARFLAGAEPQSAASCLRLMHGLAAADALAALDDESAGEILDALPLDAAAVLLRRIDKERREALLSRSPARRARSLRSLLRFGPQTAGGLMDPDVLSLPVDISVGEATRRVREAADHARYNLYAVDREQKLVGAFNLRELFLADDDALISSIARANPHRIGASADPHAIVHHPGWRDVHALPVVDTEGVYVGAIRYRTLRRLEAELRGDDDAGGATARALGDLFRTGASSMLEAVATSAAGAAPRRSQDGS